MTATKQTIELDMLRQIANAAVNLVGADEAEQALLEKALYWLSQAAMCRAAAELIRSGK